MFDLFLTLWGHKNSPELCNVLDASPAECNNGGMNKLSTARRVQVLGMLCEGMSMRAVARLAGVSFNTVAKLLMDAADAADAYHDEHVRGIRGHRHIQCDEIWAFIHCKEGHKEFAKAPPPEAGDSWTWTAIDSDSKLIVSYRVSSHRDGQAALEFMDDLHQRVEDRIQLSTDGLKVYREAVDEAFGGDVDFAQIIKEYGKAEGVDNERRYSPATCTGMETIVVQGAPNLDTANTSYVERHNLTMRMQMRRFTRLTNGFSKRLEKHAAMQAIYFYFYNWCRPNRAVRTRLDNQVTPAMAAGLTALPAKLESLVELIDRRATKPNRPKTYRKRALAPALAE